jgi:sugar/nucleoside kinase (ribokinase family)
MRAASFARGGPGRRGASAALTQPCSSRHDQDVHLEDKEGSARPGGVDVAVAAPAFIDMTFVGLEAIPEPDEERFAGDLVRSPGGGAITAVGAARLGLRSVLAAPLGEDPAGDMVRRDLERDGVAVIERRCARTPVTVVLPVNGERAMVTYDPGIRAQAADLAALEPRSVVAGLDQLDLVPPGARAYATVGSDDARAFAGRLPSRLETTQALLLDRREACELTGAGDPEEAAARLGERVESVVVMLGTAGAVAVVEGRTLRTDALATGPVVDTTGARDLLAAAWAWADLAGLDGEARLHWSVLYAGLSVSVPTGAGGAATLERLLEAGARAGLSAPPRAAV